MLLYLDTLKKTCFQKKKKKERCHFILTSYDCDFVFWFATLFLGWRREGWASG